MKFLGKYVWYGECDFKFPDEIYRVEYLFYDDKERLIIESSGFNKKGE